MATIKFWQEMQKVVTIDGQDKLMIGKNSTGEAQYVNVEDLNQFLSIQGDSIPAITGGSTPATATALPTLGDENRYFEASWGYWKYNNVVLTNPNGAQGIPDGSEGVLFWNGTTQTWSISKIQKLPVASGTNVIIEGGTEVVNQDGVFQAVNKVSKTVDAIGENFGKSEESTLINTTINPVYLSTASGFYGFGSPIGVIKNFNRVKVNIPTREIAPTSVTIVLRIGSKNGNILANVTRVGLSLTASADNFLDFDFPTIANASNDQIYLQIYADINFHEYGATQGLLFPYPEYSKSSWKKINGIWDDDATHKNIWVRAYNVINKQVPSDLFFDNFESKSGKFNELVKNNATNTSDIVVLKEFIGENSVTTTFQPSEGEDVGGAMNNPYAIGLLIQNKDVEFNEIELYISGTDNNHTLVLNVYPFDTIPTGSNILLPTSIYRQEFTGGDIAMSNKTTIRLSETLKANNKYLMLVFTNLLNGYRVQTLRKSGASLVGDYTLSYLSVNSLDPLTKPLAKNTDDIRFNSPILRLNNIKPEDLVSDLLSVLPREIEFTNNSYLFKSKTDSTNTSYFGLEFKINENVNVTGGVKDILRFQNGINHLRLYVDRSPATQMEYIQYALNGSAIPNDRPQWGNASKYPLPYYNAQVKLDIKIGNTTTTYQFPKRNLRDWKPIVGDDALMIQFKPEVIRNGGLIANNQSLYESNLNWKLKIDNNSLTLSNVDLGKSKTYSFTTYPYIDVLYQAIKLDTENGGYFEDFIIEQLNTGTISSNESGIKYTRSSNELLACEIQLVGLYPYTGYLSGANRMAFDAWKCFIPYAIDESWHTFELMTKESSNSLFFMLDGKPAQTPNTGYSQNGRLAIANSSINLGGSGYLNCSFKDLEYYNGHTNGYEGYRKVGEEHFMFIASQKNPRILGIMWHDVMFSDVVGRPTVWMDVPKNLRTPFDRQVNYNHVGAAIILYRAYGDFKEDPIDLGGGRYSVVSRTGETLAGVGTVVGGIVTQIKADTLVSGVWSTSPEGMQFWEGMINRVGNDVLISTAFLEQCFQQCKEKGYEIITWQDVLEILKGNKKTSLKYFAPQFDDWALYMFTDSNIRRLFNKYNAKISVALELNNVANADGTIKPAQTKVALDMQRNGHENVIHQHYNSNKPLEFISGILSDEAERGIIEAIYKAGEVGVTMNIHDQSANQSTPNSMKLMEYLGMELSISTQNKSTTRATPRMYASRSGLYPRYATFGSVIE